MEALIHHFKLFTEGFKVPAGETYVAIESPRGEIGCYLVSDGTGKPVRMHIRGPSFYNLQSMDPMVPGGWSPTRSRSSRASIRSWARSTDEFFTTANLARAPRRSSRATRARSRRSCRSLHLAQDQDGWVIAGGDGRDRRAPRRHPRRGARARAPSTRCSSARPCGKLVVSVCTNVSCLVNGGPELLEHLERRYAADDDVTVEEVECLAACGLAPVMQVNYEFHEQLTPDGATRSSRNTSRARVTPRTISGSTVRS